MNLKKNFWKNGYSLVEMAISMTVIAMVIAGALSYVNKVSSEDKIYLTKQRIRKIDDALDKFFALRGYLPCPSVGSALETDAAFGKTNPSFCSPNYTSIEIHPCSTYYSVDQTASNFMKCNVNNSGSEIGMVPVRTLGLSDEYAYDAWGRKFMYRIAGGMGSPIHISKVSKGIRIIDLQGAENTNLYNGKFGAAYVLVSYGANGANVTWSRNNSNTPVQATGNEAQNTDQDTVYIKTGPAAGFDDIVHYKPRIFYTKPEKKLAYPYLIPQKICSYVNQTNEYLNSPYLYNSGGTPTAPTHLGNIITTIPVTTAMNLNTAMIYALKTLSPMCKNPPPNICNFDIEQIPNLVFWADATYATPSSGAPTKADSIRSRSTTTRYLSQSTSSNMGTIDNSKAYFNKQVIRGGSYQTSPTISSMNMSYVTKFIVGVFPSSNLNCPILFSEFSLSPTNRYGIRMMPYGTGTFCFIDTYFYPAGVNIKRNSIVFPRKFITDPEPVIIVSRGGQTLMFEGDTNSNVDLYDLRIYTKSGNLYRTKRTIKAQSASPTILSNVSYAFSGGGEPNSIAEILFFDRMLSEDEVAYVVSYLNLKWLKGVCS